MRHKMVLIFVGLPLGALLMLCDVLAAAWDELSEDWRSTKHWFVSEWRDE